MIDQKAIRDARRALGQQLATYRSAAGYSQEAFAPLVQYGRSSIANVEVGRQKGSRRFWQRCDELLGTGGALTAGHDAIENAIAAQRVAVAQARRAEHEARIERLRTTDGGQRPGIRERVARAAHESQGFLAEWESRSLRPETVEEFAEDLSWLAREYVHRPLDSVFDELVAVRDRAYALLAQQRRTADVRSLLFFAGLACAMLAHASIDFGDRRAAARQAAVAGRLAAESDHHGLVAWVYGTQSLIAYCLRLPDKAVQYAERGETYTSSGNGKVRLAALRARAFAPQHDGQRAVTALRDAHRARESEGGRGDLDAIGGIVAFPAAKYSYYAASTAALLSDGRSAERHARAAITAYEAAPPELCSYGDLALSRVYLAQSHLLGPRRQQDPAAADDALAAVLALPHRQRIAGLHRPLRQVQVHLEQGSLGRSTEATELRAKIDDFLSETPAVSPS